MQTSNLLKAYLYLVVSIALMASVLWVTSAFISNSLEYRTLPEQTGIFLKLRMGAMLDALPTLFEAKEPLGVFWGASEIESGLDTDLMDELFKESGVKLHAVNAGMRSIHPIIYKIFTERVQQVLERQHTKFAVSFVKIPWNRLTRKYSRYSHFETTADQLARIMSPTDFTLLQKEPSLYVKAMADRYLLAGASTNVVPALTQGLLQHALHKTESPGQKYFSIWTDEVFMERPPWNLAARGSFHWNLPKSQAQLQTRLAEKKQPFVKEGSYDIFERCCGMKSPTVDDHLTATFIKQVKILKSISDKVVLYTIPEEKDFDRFRNPRSQEFQTELFQRISFATGLPIHDLSDNENLEQEDYLDFLHLSLIGQKKFYKELLHEVKPFLQN